MKLEEQILVRDLDEAGFPAISRWEIENNEMRKIGVSGNCLPSIGTLIYELGNKFFRLTRAGDSFIAEAPATIQEDDDDEIDTELGLNTSLIPNKAFGFTPEQALTRLWLKIK